MTNETNIRKFHFYHGDIGGNEGGRLAMEDLLESKLRNRLTLLLIEDNPGDARLLHELLRDQGGEYDIVWVQTLDEALKEIASNRFHLILCDLNLNDAQGSETESAIIAAASDLPIIIITGQDDDQVALEAIKEGVQDYLVKNTVTPELIGRSIRYAIERKRAEVKLRESEAQFRTIFEVASVGIVQADSATGRILQCNKTYCQITGYPLSELLEISFRELTHPEDRQRDWDIFSRAARGETPVYYNEKRYIRKDGSIVWVKLNAAFIRNSNGQAIRTVAICEDITERRRAGAYGEIGREVLQILNEPGDLKDSIQRVLTALKTRTGFDAVGIRLQDEGDFPYFVQEGFSEDFLLTENTLTERDANGGECRGKDGGISLECTCGLVLSGKTDPTNPLFTSGGSCWTNDSSLLLDIPPGEDPRLHPRNQCIHQGYASVALVPIRDKDRIVGLIQLNDRRKGRLSIGTVELMEGIASHIGAALMRKRAEKSLRESEDALRAMLLEKKVLLKEVHHRVKNNLQVMSSLISLQTDSLTDERLKGVLSDVRGRIISMALIHEKLYQTDALAKLNFGEYAATLLQYLWRTHGAAAEKVRLNMSFAPLILPAEMAVHCGLILNELASNAIKHAFPGNSACEVSVILDHEPSTGDVCLRVCDNGVGLPADLNWRQASSLGLRLVQMLAGQMHGTVQTGPGPGTEFRVNFTI